jgi:hypothetical protein
MCHPEIWAVQSLEHLADVGTCGIFDRFERLFSRVFDLFEGIELIRCGPLPAIRTPAIDDLGYSRSALDFEHLFAQVRRALPFDEPIFILLERYRNLTVQSL